LNTSTIRDEQGRSRPLAESIQVAQRAGYEAIEPWTHEIEAYLQSGGTLSELKHRLDDARLRVADLIGFAEWIVNDNTRRRKGLDLAQRYMEWAAQLHCPHLAAPPVGATGGTSPRDDPRHSEPVTDLLAAAERYQALVEIGQRYRVVPLLEIWGFSRTLRRLGEALFIAAESLQPHAAILPDIYHLYKGGSGFDGLRLLAGSAIGIFHLNDYPDIAPSKITDADRVFPGDGVAPLTRVLSHLRAIGYHGYLSLELFNRSYWKQDPLQVARTGLERMRQVVASAATDR
jgi:sugar phosphate isomerase/epimerase